MANYDYKADAGKKASVQRAAEQAIAEQKAVATYTANLAGGKKRRDACHQELFDALTELGAAPPALPWTNGVKIDETDGNWVLKINEA